jgi:hypothetical protein
MKKFISLFVLFVFIFTFVPISPVYADSVYPIPSDNYEVDFTTYSYDGGATTTISITNISNTLIENWFLLIEIDNYIGITNSWCGTFEEDYTTIGIAPENWNKTIEPNSTIYLGFTSDYTLNNIENIELYSGSGVDIPEPTKVYDDMYDSYLVAYGEVVQITYADIIVSIVDITDNRNLDGGEAVAILDVWEINSGYLGSIEIKAPPATPTTDMISSSIYDCYYFFNCHEIYSGNESVEVPIEESSVQFDLSVIALAS